MSSTVDPPGGLVEQGAWLVEHRFEMDRGESTWLANLADFDREQGWALDGQLSCIDWLAWRARMARATTYEKLQVAHELSRRQVIAEAFSAGRISYSAVRAMCRMDRPDREVDEKLVALAEAATVADVERAVRHCQLHADQHRPPADPLMKRSLRVKRGAGGISTLEVVLSDIEIDEVTAALRAVIEADRPIDQSAAAESAGPVDESACAESPGAAPLEEIPYPQLRADALLDLVRIGVSHLGDGPPAGADRYMVHFVKEADQPVALVDGTPVSRAQAEAVQCDCSMVEHLYHDGEPLAMGRRTRTWTTAQRRAILVRDHGRCRFPGCYRRVTEIHHLRSWEHGGPTDVANGLLICPAHHTKLHAGYSYRGSGDTNHPVLFLRPGGTPIGYG